jgi:catecholate siderophore receptor
VRNSTRLADYDKYYENLVPGAVNRAALTVSLTGYNSSTERQNVFNQTDLVWGHRTGAVTHTVLAGVEVGRQATGNRRLTSYFSSISPTTTSIAVPLSNPTTTLPVEFRAAPADADNHGVATVAAVYAQDQMTLTSRLQAIVGMRYDSFRVDLTDHRTSTLLSSRDGLLSPRLAMIYKPVTALSLYTSYTRSYLPRAGEQLASLSLTTQALEPENYRNLEAGAKWDIKPFLALTTAVYRLDHGNVVVRDAVDPNISHLVDAERSVGLELEVSGSLSDRWTVQGGYAYQDGEITESLSATVRAGARLAQVPRHSFSLWNRVDVSPMWGAGVGIISRSDSFVATDNTVTLPGFTRVDGGVFFTLSPSLRAHVNVENVFNTRYYWSAHNNNNIAPGSPRALRVTLTTLF